MNLFPDQSDSPRQLFLPPLPASSALAEEPALSPHTHQPLQDSYSFYFSKATSLLAQPFQLPFGFLALHCRDNMLKTTTYKSFAAWGILGSHMGSSRTYGEGTCSSKRGNVFMWNLALRWVMNVPFLQKALGIVGSQSVRCFTPSHGTY